MTLLWLAAAVFYVAPNGADRNAGTAQAPFATLERAREAARGATKPATIYLKPGTYSRREPLTLGAEDSGVAWLAAPGGAVRLSGGQRITKFETAKDRRLRPEAAGKVLVCDLRAEGITDFGRMQSRGFSRPITPAHLELFFNGKRMTMARWPNEGFAHISGVGDADPQDDGHGRKIGRIERGFSFQFDKPARWKGSGDAWVHGYWAWDWANTYEAVESIDWEKGFVKTKAPYGLYGFRTGQRFYFLNVLEELDQPGEYYVDTKQGLLYFWPPAAMKTAEIAVSIMEKPLVDVQNARDVKFSGVTFELVRGTAVHVAGGERVRVENCVVRNVGDIGIAIDGGVGHQVDRCEVYQTGDAGITMAGGDRMTLTPGKHSVTNSSIHHIAEWSRTYQPGVRLTGVGLRVAHNVIHDSPHNGILLNGNDHVIEFNEIHRVCLETGDVGAFYMGRDWTERGVQIRHNYFHDTGGVGMGSMGVYLDDCASGATVYGNIFCRTQRAVFIGGGRDHRVDNNIFVDCEPAVHVDSRGLDARPVWHDMIYKTMRESALAVRFLEPPYITRYPELRTIEPYYAVDTGVPPEGNVIVHNVCWRGKWLDLRWKWENPKIEIRDNLVDSDPLFVNLERGDFRLRPESPAWKTGFKTIPVERIGIERRR